MICLQNNRQNKNNTLLWKYWLILFQITHQQSITHKVTQEKTLQNQELTKLPSVSRTPSLKEVGEISSLPISSVISMDMSAGDLTPRST